MTFIYSEYIYRYPLLSFLVVTHWKYKFLYATEIVLLHLAIDNVSKNTRNRLTCCIVQFPKLVKTRTRPWILSNFSRFRESTHEINPVLSRFLPTNSTFATTLSHTEIRISFPETYFLKRTIQQEPELRRSTYINAET